MPEGFFYVNLIFKGVFFVSTLDDGRFMHKIVSITLLNSKSNIRSLKKEIEYFRTIFMISPKCAPSSWRLHPGVGVFSAASLLCSRSLRQDSYGRHF